MSPTAQPIEWYIARDGRQHGPLNDGEIQKLVELGHLRPTDLVWRAGMTDWRLASVVFQRPAPSQPQPSRPQPPAPAPSSVVQPQRTEARPQSHQQPMPSGAPLHQPTAPQRSTQPQVGGKAHPSPIASAVQSPTATRPQQPHGPVTVTAPAPATAQGPATRQPAEVQKPYEPQVDDEDDGDRPRWGLRIAALIGAALIGSGVAIGLKVTGLNQSLPSASALVSPITSFVAGLLPGGGAHSAETLAIPPFVAMGETPEAIDGALQKAASWRVAKREFPEWYAERVKEAARLRAAKTENAAVSRRLAESFVELRRKHADQALAAAPERVGIVATAFLDSLRAFSKHSVDACYGYISQGEVSPAVLSLSATGNHGAQLQKQVTAVLDAIADGRRSPRTYLPPRKGDYDVLAKELTSRGWSDGDLKTFSDPKALARSTPEQVCKMVQDWFAAQMAIKDAEIRQRLIVESLRPVVAG